MVDMVHCRGCGAEIHRTAAKAVPSAGQANAARYKNKITAGVLALFLGGLGIHRFYLGRGGASSICSSSGRGFRADSPDRRHRHPVHARTRKDGTANTTKGFRAKVESARDSVASSSVHLSSLRSSGYWPQSRFPPTRVTRSRRRSRKGLSLATESKAAVAEAILRRGQMPLDRSKAGLSSNAADSSGKCVQSHCGQQWTSISPTATRRADRGYACRSHLSEEWRRRDLILWRCAYAPSPASPRMRSRNTKPAPYRRNSCRERVARRRAAARMLASAFTLKTSVVELASASGACISAVSSSRRRKASMPACEQRLAVSSRWP